MFHSQKQLHNKAKTTKSDLIDSIYATSELEKRQVIEVVESFISELKKAILSGETIEIRGFGTFETKTRKSRIARNPKTGEKITTKEHRTVSFRSGSELKKSL